MRDPQLHIPIAQRVLLTKLSRGCSLCDAQVSRNSELSTQNSDTKERWADDHGLSTFLRTPNRCYKLLHREQKDPSQPHTKPAPGVDPNAHRADVGRHPAAADEHDAAEGQGAAVWRPSVFIMCRMAGRRLKPSPCAVKHASMAGRRERSLVEAN